MPCPPRNGERGAARYFFPLISLSQRENVHCCEMGERGIPVPFLSPGRVGRRIIEQNRAGMASLIGRRGVLNKARGNLILEHFSPTCDVCTTSNCFNRGCETSTLQKWTGSKKNNHHDYQG